jgi:hypothetical protein
MSTADVPAVHYERLALSDASLHKCAVAEFSVKMSKSPADICG